MQNLHADIALEVSPESLVDLIESRSRYSDLHGWMRLADCVAQALLVLRNGDDIQRLAPLAAAVAELDRVKKIKSPRWVGDMLARAVEEWTETPKVAATEMVIPLLTLQLLKGDPTFGQKAEAIIHESYHCYLAGTATPADLHLLRLCPDYCPSPL